MSTSNMLDQNKLKALEAEYNVLSDKIKKLKALTSSPNKNEAWIAEQKANELIKKQHHVRVEINKISINCINCPTKYTKTCANYNPLQSYCVHGYHNINPCTAQYCDLQYNCHNANKGGKCKGYWKIHQKY